MEGIGPVETFLKGYVAGVLLVDFGLLGGGHVGVVIVGRWIGREGRLDRWWKGSEEGCVGGGNEKCQQHNSSKNGIG